MHADVTVAIAREALERGLNVRLRVHGASMTPALADGSDVEIVPLGALRAGQVVACAVGPRLVVHRIYRLTPDGVVIINMLPMPGMTWNDLMIPFTHSFRRVCVIHFEGYVNRVVVAGKRLATASEVSRRIRAELHSVESAMAFEIRLRTLARGD